ncbi:GNAT family N-acetyltransferase [Halobacillus amylolyticus]|uniref:GNAT family N-acetyltransferase n=1 Tax=Halobacillus amylolyticus TaxID=2932259 RepID=A0ABY4HD29_9BACI|nr:GNAT family N-acetyltransferase [Halobacillus amylolyticus]UOR12806.1 GNAT family N-acetyltransferase [Halobacillus amylolyticus]
MKIFTERLSFRRYEDKDLEFLISMLSDPEMVRFIGNGHTKNREGARQFLDWIYSTYRVGSDLGLRVLVRREENIPVGHAGLVPQMIDGVEELEIGYWISRKYWGQGYASEAAEALRKHGFQRFGKQRLIALIQPGNVGSIEVAKKIRMDFEKRTVLSGQEVHIYSVS